MLYLIYVFLFPVSNFLFLLDSFFKQLRFFSSEELFFINFILLSLSSSLYNQTAWKSLLYLILFFFSFCSLVFSSLISGSWWCHSLQALEKYISALSVTEVLNTAFNIVNHFLHHLRYFPLCIVKLYLPCYFFLL